MRYIGVLLALILLLASCALGAEDDRRRTADIHGNNTPGPYSLGFEKIVQGSERVTIDGVQTGVENYSIDYERGLILFKNNRTIPDSVIIHVTFMVQAQTKPKSRAEKLVDALARDFTISGFANASFRSLGVTGNASNYTYDNFGDSGKFSNNSEFYISGKLLNYLTLDMTLSRNRFFPTDQRLNLKYERRGQKLEMGDIPLHLTGNELVSFSKNVKGVQLVWPITKRGTFSFIQTQAKHSTRSVTLKGQNTSGPYYLGYFPVVEGSERVRVDELDKSSADYEMEYETGVLYFKQDQIVTETSTIYVTFETKTTVGQGGEIQGYRLEYSPMASLKMGFIQLEQSAGGGGTTSDTVLWTDNLLGDGSGGPYQLYHGPVVEASETVRVQGVLQTRDTDYQIDYSLGLIVFSYAVPSDQNIVVSYRQKVDKAITGNRKVMGYDLVWKPMSTLTINHQYGKSNADADGAPGGGAARSTRLAYQLQRRSKEGRMRPFLNLNVTDTKTDPGFATIENASFRRNTSGRIYGLELVPWEYVRFTYDKTDSMRPRGFSSIPGQNTGLVNFGSNGWRMVVNFPKLPSVTYTTSKTSTIDNLEPHQYAYSQETNNLLYSYTRGKMSITGSQIKTTNQNFAQTDYASGSSTSRVSVAFLASERLSFSTDLSKSKILGSSGKTSNADTQRFHFYYAPMTALNLTVDFSNQVSDGSVTGGYFPTGSVLGDPQTPFSRMIANAYGDPLFRHLTENGVGRDVAAIFVTRGRDTTDIGDDTGTSGSKISSKSVNLAWNPSTKLTATLTYFSSSSDAQYTSNTDSERKGITVGWNPSERLSLMATLSRDDLKYIGEEGSMSSDNRSLTLRVGPWRKFTVDLNYYKMNSGNSFSFSNPTGQASASPNISNTVIDSLSLNIQRPISKRITSFLTFQKSKATGYRSSDRSNGEFGLNYNLTEHLTFTLSAEATDYKDCTDAQSNYSLRSVGASLDLRF